MKIRSEKYFFRRSGAYFPTFKKPALTGFFIDFLVLGIDLLLLMKATIGADRLNCRVREGIGCTSVARNTEN